MKTRKRWTPAMQEAYMDLVWNNIEASALSAKTKDLKIILKRLLKVNNLLEKEIAKRGRKKA